MSTQGQTVMVAPAGGGTMQAAPASGGMMQAVPPGMVVRPETPPYDNYKVDQAKYLGIVQIILGGLAIVFQIVCIIVGAEVSSLGAGIVSGIFFCVSGVLSLLSKNRNQCLIISSMIMSIISHVFAWYLMIVASVGVGADNYCEYYDYYYFSYQEKDCKEPEKLAFNALLIFVAIVEMVITIWQSVVCCNALCCGRRTSTLGTVMYTNYPQQPQQVIISSGQPGAHPLGYGVAPPGYAVAPPMYSTQAPPQYGQPVQAVAYPQVQPMQNPGSTSAGPSAPNQGIPPSVVTDGIPANKH